MGDDRIFNFSAGPATLPLGVLKQAQEELLSFQKTGMSVMEMSHRSGAFGGILERAEAGVRKLLSVPPDYAVLFLQGGASHQFAMVPINLAIPDKPVDMIQTGSWTQKASQEIEKLGSLRLAASTESEGFLRLPRADEIHFSSGASYVHMASNNTIFGTQWKTFPKTGDIPLVSDMSSDILSRPVDISQFGLVFAGAQKNLGPSGVTLVILKKDLAERASKNIPSILQYRSHIKAGSLYNTPPTFGIYLISLVMEWLEKQGGVREIQKSNEQKSRLLYKTIDDSHFYYGPVSQEDRSNMNVVFRIQGNKEDLEKRFAQEAETDGMTGLKGHRSVGGLRASLYNAQSLEAVQSLVSFMKNFEARNG